MMAEDRAGLGNEWSGALEEKRFEMTSVRLPKCIFLSIYHIYITWPFLYFYRVLPYPIVRLWVKLCYCGFSLFSTIGNRLLPKALIYRS